MKTAPPEPSRSASHKIINFVVSVAVIAACLFGYTLLGERTRPTRSKPPKPLATPVSTETLTLHEGPISIESNGVVVPLREIRLATEVPGRVVEQSVNLRAGRMVAEGEVLIRMDPIEYELEVRRLRGQQGQEAAELSAIDVSIDNTKQVLDIAEQQLELAEAERARIESLVQRQAGSAAEVDVARRAELTSKAALIEVQNRRRELIAQRQLTIEKKSLTEIALELAQLNLARTTIKSPIRGRVIESQVEEQSYIAAGTSFVTIEDTSAVEIRSNLTVQQMYWVWNADPDNSLNQIATKNNETSSEREDQIPAVPATVQYRLGARVYQWNAVLERIDGVGIDLATRTYPCLFRVNEPDVVERISGAMAGPKRLMRGMFVSVNLQAASQRTLFDVSESAIRPGNRIWLNVDGQLRILPIEIISRAADRVVIDIDEPDSNFHTSTMPDLNATVIVSPISDPRTGMPLSEEGGSSDTMKSTQSGPEDAEDHERISRDNSPASIPDPEKEKTSTSQKVSG